ncbi:hypothetical protein [Pseudonocardia oroxyli]|uniref:Cupin domain-containing protein n=1 Tax=Pseudonocardia oroxyli TaxID=366584 RepID=A0A1G7GBA6_PSEOR|nr:hypothetical protein [Pseudonocardia oroxyli]SDE85309.1 hypothetical protein SAMN05216377_102283 [Pseudonocardia oroxyli]
MDRFDRRRITIEAGTSRPHDEDEWRGVLVLVEAGEIELRCALGGRRRFRAGAVLWFSGLDLREVHNPGVDRAVVVAVSRTRSTG